MNWPKILNQGEIKLLFQESMYRKKVSSQFSRCLHNILTYHPYASNPALYWRTLIS